VKEAMRKLGNQLRPKLPLPAQLTHGTVTAIDTGTDTISVNLGDPANPTTNVPVLPGYYPTVGDYILLHKMGPALVAAGKAGPVVAAAGAACRLSRSTLMSVVSGGTEPGGPLGYNVEVTGDLNIHDNVTNNTRIRVGDYPGWWSYGAQVEWDNGQTAGKRSVAIVANGATLLERVRNFQGHTTIEHGQVVTGAAKFTAGDYIEVFVYQNSGVNIVVDTTFGPWFWAVREG
jgi:hypothetical protein